MSAHQSISRRSFLRSIVAMCGSLAGASLLASCQPQVVEVQKEVTKIVKETVVVEGTPQVVEKVITSAPAPLKPIQIRFWMWNTYAPAADDVLEDGIQRWASENNVTIVISRDSDGKYRDKVMPALEAGTLPDAMFIGADVALLMMNAKGIVPVTDLFKEVGDAHGGWQRNLEQYVTRDGEVYFLPYSIDTPMVHYRADIFEEAGIQVPEGQWTWEETRDLCKQAQDYTQEKGQPLIGWGFGIVKQQHDGWCGDVFRNYGAWLYDETGTKFVLKDEHKEDLFRALDFMKSAQALDLFPKDAASWDWSSNNKSFQEEQCILVINAASIYTWSQTNKPDLAERIGLVAKPKEKHSTTDAGLRYTVVMCSTAKEKETAADLMRGVYMSDVYAPWLEKGFVTNVVKEYDALPMWTGKRAKFLEAVDKGVYPGYPAPYDNAAMAEAGGPNDPVGAITVRVLVDGWDYDRALDEADAFVKGIFKKHFG